MSAEGGVRLDDREAYYRVRLALLVVFTASSDERIRRGTDAVLAVLASDPQASTDDLWAVIKTATQAGSDAE